MNQQLVMASEAIDIVLSDKPQRVARLELGDVLQRMFGADVFVSYVSDGSGPYADPVQLNMGEGRLEAYERHFRHVDRMTPKLFAAGSVGAVSTDNSAADEFVVDFLRPQNMHHGLNYFPQCPGPGAIDLRLWRGRESRPFTDTETNSFRSFGDLLARLWPKTSPAQARPLSPRELEVARLVSAGHGDKQIARQLGISHPTLRTHLRNAFEKTGAENRVLLAAHYLRHHHY